MWEHTPDYLGQFYLTSVYEQDEQIALLEQTGDTVKVELIHRVHKTEPWVLVPHELPQAAHHGPHHPLTEVSDVSEEGSPQQIGLSLNPLSETGPWFLITIYT